MALRLDRPRFRSSASRLVSLPDGPGWTPDPVEFIAANEVYEANSTSLTLSVPSGADTGDFLLLYVAKYNDELEPELPTGWTEVLYGASNIRGGKLMWKVLGSESSVTVSWPTSTNKKAVGILAAFSGVNAIADVTGTVDTATSIQHATVDTCPDSSIVVYGGFGDNQTYTVDASTTEIHQIASASGSAVSAYMAYEAADSAPAQRTVTYSAGTSEWVPWTVTLANTGSEPSQVLGGLWHWGQVRPSLVEDSNNEAIASAVAPGHQIRLASTNGDVADNVFTKYTTEVDDHTHPALLVPSDQVPFGVHTFHDSDNSIRYRLGSSAEDITTFGGESTLTDTTVSYAQTLRNGTDIFVWVRTNDTAWSCAWSDSGWGTGWTTPVSVFDVASGLVYMVHTQVNQFMYIWAFEDYTSPNNVYYFSVNLSTGALSSGGNLDGTGLPERLGTDISAALSTGGSNRFFVQDCTVIGGLFLAVLYVDNTDGTDGVHKLAFFNGSSWTVESIVAAGSSGFGGGGAQYAGSCFIPTAAGVHVLLAIEDSGTYKLVRYQRTGADTWVEGETLQSSSMILARPRATTNWYGFARIFNYDLYNDFQARTEIWPL